MSDIDFRTTPVADLVRSVRAKEVSAAELTETALDRIGRLDPTYNAFVAVDGERALAEADALDAKIAGGGDPGPLAGIPIGVKDLQDAAGYTTTYGSALHADDPPAQADSPFVARLRAAGCIVVGKTNTPEFGWMGNTTNSIFGPSRNPFDHSPGRVAHRAAPPPRWPPAWSHSPPAPTAVAPSASRPRAAASPA